jgi:predicted transcriptional regulator
MQYAWHQPSTKSQLAATGEAVDYASGSGAKASYLAAVEAIYKYAGPLNLAAAAG